MAHQEKRVARPGSAQNLLNRILAEPGLVQAVQSLPAGTLYGLIEQVGLEDSAELVALASTEQLKKIFDEDLWRNAAPGREETLDADRFARWLEVLSELGSEFAAQKILDWDEEFFTAALSQQVLVLNLDELILQNATGTRQRSIDPVTEKALESSLNQEFENYIVIAKHPEGWDALIAILTSIDSLDHGYLMRVLARLCHLTAESIEDQGGLYSVLTAREQIHADVAFEREKRREQEGFVTPLVAAGFLRQARQATTEAILDEKDPDEWTRSHLKALRESDKVPAPSINPSTSRLLSLIDDASAGNHAALSVQRGAILFNEQIDELGFLANLLVAGVSIDDRRFRAVEAAEAASATIRLGAEIYGSMKDVTCDQALREAGFVTLFKLGWSSLHHELAMPLLSGLVSSLDRLIKATAGDFWLKQQLAHLLAVARKCCNEGDVSQLRGKLDFLGVFSDASSVATLEAALDQFPWIRASTSIGQSARFVSSRKELQELLHACRTALNSFSVESSTSRLKRN